MADKTDPMAVVEALASAQAGIISRRAAYAAGVTRWQVLAQVNARRWQCVGDQSLCLHTGPLSDEAHWWAAVFQGGPRAKLDGAASLIASGLERFTVDRIRVSVPRGGQARRTALYDIRQTRRWDQDDIAASGVPRTRPANAAVRAALWAASDREATFVLTVTVQQGLASPEAIGEAALRVKRDKRRRLVLGVVGDLLDGGRSLGELDVGRELRRRGLPRPNQQSLRRDRRGRYYLDLYWQDYGLVVEIDGIQHTWANNIVGDALRQNSLAISGDTVLRLPLLGLRLCPDDFFAQIEQALRAKGWAHAA
ncbi:DUF559 domain-containing protein [Nocardioides sp.]|uniref:DUF559 domain-containing protein n=1 Tax=Nocardioides sp. TaxID=35761 RepID=UPI0035665C7A